MAINNSIKTFINSLTKNKISKLKIDTNTTKILINTSTKKNLLNKQQIIKNINNKQKINNISENIIEKKKVTPTVPGLYATIISPMVGTFYKSPAPNENAFVEIGDLIKTKQIVCIIEAMKLMNEIESEVKGEVVEILVKDGDIVDCGQALMKIKIK
uniref:Biotin carboxyl carrier protein of acetyl-CoA carboxylase n=1 Tax=Kapraunia schneideri TaxID=717899 RepID=A0A1Z1MSZ0_9FLOR|nr:acetyl-CoA carboxylase biotin carboxyl carrier protein [Kapraunia schneideri]ARW68942.1 acetyl-CoA carboxylase biotin carboxyl carrier protein [Kapraunia schneideri]